MKERVSKFRPWASTWSEKTSVTCPVCLLPIPINPPGLYGAAKKCERCGQEVELVCYRGITDPAELEKWLADFCVPARSTSFDYETTSLDVFACRIVGVSFCPEEHPGKAVYVPIGHRLGDNMPREAAEAIVRDFISQYPVNAHNFDFEYRVSVQKLGVAPMIHADSMIDAWLDDINRGGGEEGRFEGKTLKLKGLAQELFQIDPIEIHDLIDLNQFDFSYVDTPRAIIYGCQDSDLATRIKRKFYYRNRGPAEQRGQPAIHLLEHDLISMVAEMELRGVLIDTEALAAAGPVLVDEEERLLSEIEQLSGHRIDVSSPDQVSDLLFRKMGVPIDNDFLGKPTKKWPAGQPSTSKKALALLKDEYPIVDLILQIRQVKYARENYVEKLPGKLRPETSTLHGSFNQTGTSTGRFSSSGPNLQNLAKVRD